MTQDVGRSPASQGRAGALRAEPATQSQAKPLVPNALLRKLSPIQRSILTRGVVRIGKPEVLVPRIAPWVPERTWDAVENKGLIEYGRFGYALTDLGKQVREHLLASGIEGEAGDPKGLHPEGESPARSEAKGDAR